MSPHATAVVKGVPCDQAPLRGARAADGPEPNSLGTGWPEGTSPQAEGIGGETAVVSDPGSARLRRSARGHEPLSPVESRGNQLVCGIGIGNEQSPSVSLSARGHPTVPIAVLLQVLRTRTADLVADKNDSDPAEVAGASICGARQKHVIHRRLGRRLQGHDAWTEIRGRAR